MKPSHETLFSEEVFCRQSNNATITKTILYAERMIHILQQLIIVLHGCDKENTAGVCTKAFIEVRVLSSCWNNMSDILAIFFLKRFRRISSCT